MNKFLLVLSCLICNYAFAQLNGTGFYRVVNVADSRYIYVSDNTGDPDPKAPDMGAVQLIKGLDKAVSNPSTVLYFSQINGNEYDIKAQGTSVKQIIGHMPSIYYSSRADAYQVYATVYGATVYLGSEDDPYYANKEVSMLSIGAKGNYNLWKVCPITEEGDNYFGIKPTIEIDGKYYQPFYADFAFSFFSEGMKAYYIKDISGIAAHLVPIEDEIIPASTPVIIECSSSEPDKNRLKLHASGGKSISDNKLKGVYFNNPLRIYSKDAVTKFDRNTMRVLGKTSDGKLGFVLSTAKNLAANQAYLSVASGSEETIYAMNSNDFASLDGVSGDADNVKNVYSIIGTRCEGSFEELPAGIYIVNGKKVIKK